MQKHEACRGGAGDGRSSALNHDARLHYLPDSTPARAAERVHTEVVDGVVQPERTQTGGLHPPGIQAGSGSSPGEMDHDSAAPPRPGGSTPAPQLDQSKGAAKVEERFSSGLRRHIYLAAEPLPGHRTEPLAMAAGVVASRSFMLSNARRSRS